MGLNIRKLLAEMMGQHQVTDAEIRSELEELKIDNRLESLTRDGHLPTDPTVQELARLAIKGQANSDQLEQLLRAPKPAPIAAHVITPPAGPAAGGDLVEAAIQAEMQRAGVPYHQAASTVALGGTLQGGNE